MKKFLMLLGIAIAAMSLQSCLCYDCHDYGMYPGRGHAYYQAPPPRYTPAPPPRGRW